MRCNVCSPACRRLRRKEIKGKYLGRKRAARVCNNCGDSFIPTAPRQAGCSPECRKNHRKSIKAALNRKYNQRDRRIVLEHYGGKPARCACCGESTYEFLAIDHINGGGNQHRKRLSSPNTKSGTFSSREFYRMLKTQGFPAGYQVLCHNCNMAKGFYGKCPHQR
jgi:hypothetical protein